MSLVSADEICQQIFRTPYMYSQQGFKFQVAVLTAGAGNWWVVAIVCPPDLQYADVNIANDFDGTV